MFQKILVALDNSEIGEHVFNEAISLAKAVDANVMLLHVLSPFDGGYLNPVLLQPNGVYPTLHTEAVNKYMQQWEQLKQEKLDMLLSFAEKAKQAGIITEFSENLGDPGRAICEVARSWQADLIIVGRRGRKGLSEFFLGSVSNYVLHNASCSVLTVQGPIQDHTEVPQATNAASA
ncbi:universal stress protein [Scytonema sp. PCC 10023]|uniref:universal stress protein n=1 Tax=Scytonema sp. PCC 10023 TaxID=1680591 RepID=UPI0039C7554F